MIIYIPGIGGSELSDNRGVIWPPANSHDAGQGIDQYLRFRALPIPQANDGIRPTGVVGTQLATGLFDLEAQYGLVQRLRELAAGLGREFYAFAYDWRRSMAETAALLNVLIGKRTNVSLVCQGFGGLVALFYSEALGGRERIERVVTLGTPFHGSLAPLRYLASPLNNKIWQAFGAAGAGEHWGAATWPSLHECMPQAQITPRPPGLVGDDLKVGWVVPPDEGAEARLLSFEAHDVAACGGDAEAFAAGREVHDRLRGQIDQSKLAETWVTICGVGHRTPDRLSYAGGDPQFRYGFNELLDSGDQAVLLRSSRLFGLFPHPVSQSHMGLLGDATCDAVIRAAQNRHDDPAAFLASMQAQGDHPAALAEIPEVVMQGDTVELATGDSRDCKIVPTRGGEPVHVEQIDDGMVAHRFEQPGVYRIELNRGTIRHFLIVVPEPET